MSIRKFIQDVAGRKVGKSQANKYVLKTIGNPQRADQLGQLSADNKTVRLVDGTTYDAILGGTPSQIDRTIALNSETRLITRSFYPTLNDEGGFVAYLIVYTVNLDFTLNFFVRKLGDLTLYPIDDAAVSGHTQNVGGYTLESVKFSPNGKHILVGGFIGTNTDVLTSCWGIMENWSLSIVFGVPTISFSLAQGSSAINHFSIDPAPTPPSPGNPGNYVQTFPNSSTDTWTWQPITDPNILDKLPIPTTFLTFSSPTYNFSNDIVGNPIVDVCGVYQSEVDVYSCFHITELDTFGQSHPTSVPPSACGGTVTTICTETDTNNNTYSLSGVSGIHVTVTTSFVDTVIIAGTISGTCPPPYTLDCGTPSSISGSFNTVVSAFPTAIGDGQIGVDNTLRFGPCSLVNSNVSYGLFVTRGVQAGGSTISLRTRNTGFTVSIGPNPNPHAGYTSTGGYITTTFVDDGGNQSNLIKGFRSIEGSTANGSNIINIVYNQDLVEWWRPYLLNLATVIKFDVFTDTHHFPLIGTSDWSSLNAGVKALDSEIFEGCKSDLSGVTIKDYKWNTMSNQIVNTGSLSGLALAGDQTMQDFINPKALG